MLPLMDWAGKSHPVETLAEWGAPLVLAAAAAWAASVTGLPSAAKAAGGVMALSAGIVAMRMAGAVSLAREPGFEPVELEPTDEFDVLLLEDRLGEPAADSRVVQLFAQPDPTPGELVLRISDYLSEQGKPAVADFPSVEHQVDASAALHAALANIRATLR
jgi:hypothetical protein